MEIMDYIRDFASSFQQAFAQCQAQIDRYPAHFRGEALAYLERLDILAPGFQGNAMSQLLPFWLEPVYETPPQVCRDISAANTFGFLYFLLQDMVMDAPPGDCQAGLLPLANLFLFDFYEGYRRLFPREPRFWVYFQNYCREWAESVTRERRGFWSSRPEFSETNLLELARKASPIKLSAAAACWLAGRERDIKPLARSIDHTVITFQLLDDWNDWLEDLVIGNCSFFLSQVMECCGFEVLAEVQEDHVRTAVYGFNVFERMVRIAEANHALLTSPSAPYVPYLIAYHQSLLETFREMAADIEGEKKAMLQGGFSYLLHHREK